MVDEIPEGYLSILDVISKVLNIDDFDATDGKCMGLLSRTQKAIKHHKFNSGSTVIGGVRYFNVDDYKKWAKPYIKNFLSIEKEEQLKLDNLTKANEVKMQVYGVENLNELLKSHDKAYKFRKERQKGADKANEPPRLAKNYCIERAGKIWEDADNSNVAMIGEVCDDLYYELVKKKMWYPESKEKIREWLKDANKKGQLNIPAAATRPGRPKNKK